MVSFAAAGQREERKRFAFEIWSLTLGCNLEFRPSVSTLTEEGIDKKEKDSSPPRILIW